MQHLTPLFLKIVSFLIHEIKLCEKIGSAAYFPIKIKKEF